MRECPKCKAKEYNDRSMVMMINECGHPLCRNCVENLFARNSGPCPRCGKTLWKKGFWQQKFDDPMVEKENFFRKKLKKVYNLKSEDFDNLRDFNDYLERFEVLVHNFTNDMNLQESEAEVVQFKEQYTELIEKNKRKLSEDHVWVRELLEEERKIEVNLRESQQKDKSFQKAVSAKAIIDELRDSDLPAEVILDRQRKRQIEFELAEKEEAAKRRKSKIERRHDTASYAPARVSGAPYIYRAPLLQINGPPLPSMEQLSSLGFLQHVRPISVGRLAGGFTPEMCCMRALIEAHVDLFEL